MIAIWPDLNSNQLRPVDVKRQEHIYEVIITESNHCQVLQVIQKVSINICLLLTHLRMLCQQLFAFTRSDFRGGDVQVPQLVEGGGGPDFPLHRQNDRHSHVVPGRASNSTKRTAGRHNHSRYPLQTILKWVVAICWFLGKICLRMTAFWKKSVPKTSFQRMCKRCNFQCFGFFLKNA